MTAPFGVDRSIRGRVWRLAEVDAAAVARLSSAFDLPEAAARFLVGRGIDAETAEPVLRPTLRALTPDPSTLIDLDRAVERLVRGIHAGERVGVLTDYDVDGATSAAVLIRVLRALGVETVLEAPDRLIDGYGPNIGALRRLKAAGAGPILCLDCGATAFAALEAAHGEGMEIIVVDHHKGETAPPPALAVVNPNRPDDQSGLGMLAAVGVVFMLCIGLLRALRADGVFGQDRAEPDLRRLLDLVALGTVADVVPLTGLNRAFVSQGLKVMAATEHTGLDALIRVAGLNGAPEASWCGFGLGPRVNAGGRVGRADTGAKLLTTDDPSEADALALALDGDNRKRQTIEAEALAQAQADALAQADAPILLVGREGWHPGVIGIVAGRLKDRFDKPAFAIAWEGDQGKGSGRAPAGCDLGAAVLAARREGMLVSGGGHPAAAGITVAREHYDAFAAFITDWAASNAPTDPIQPLDGALTPAGASVALADALSMLAPFGVGFPEPRYAVAGALVDVRRMGKEDNHLRLKLRGLDGAALEAVCFDAFASPPRGGPSLGQALLGARDRRVALAGKLRRDAWRGRVRAQLFVEDAALDVATS